MSTTVAHARAAATVRTTPASAHALTYDGFRTTLRARLDDEPVMDGESHPAESVIGGALRSDSSQARAWLETLLAEYVGAHPQLGADLLRCIGRNDRALLGEWGTNVIRGALQHPSMLVRDAAIATIGEWLDPALFATLRPDEEPDPDLAASLRSLRAYAG